MSDQQQEEKVKRPRTMSQASLPRTRGDEVTEDDTDSIPLKRSHSCYRLCSGFGMALGLILLFGALLAVVFQFVAATQKVQTVVLGASSIVLPLSMPSVWLSDVSVTTVACVTALTEDCTPPSLQPPSNASTAAACHFSAALTFRNRAQTSLNIPVGRQIWSDLVYDWTCLGTGCTLNKTQFPSHNASTLTLEAWFGPTALQPFWSSTQTINRLQGRWTERIQYAMDMSGTDASTLTLTARFAAHPESNGSGFGVANLTLMSFPSLSCPASSSSSNVATERRFSVPHTSLFSNTYACLHVTAPSTTGVSECRTTPVTVELHPRLALVVPLLVVLVVLLMMYTWRFVLTSFWGPSHRGFDPVQTDDYPFGSDGYGATH